MAFISTNSTAIAMHARYAPRVNLVTSTTTSTTPEKVNPVALMTRLVRIRRRATGSCSVRSNRGQCIAGQDRGQHWEAVECGVRSQHQDQRGDPGEVDERRRAVAEHRRGNL